MLPNLKHLKYLLALHKHQNFNRAADACYVSQSTLSSAIIKLEEQLNCQLIERDHKAFIFTTQGEVVVEMAQKLLISAQELLDYGKQQGNPASGSVRIGCIPTIAPYLLTDLVKQCQQTLPELALYLREDSTDNLMAMLANGEIDTAILALPVQGHNFRSKVVGKDAFYIAGDAGLVKLYAKDMDFQQLPQQSIFLLTHEHCLTEHAVSACQLADASRINHFSASSLATLVQMTAYHKGFTFLPEMAVNKSLGVAEGLTIKALSPDVYREIGLLWRPTSLRQQTFLRLANILEQLLLPGPNGSQEEK
ncbi:hydrogen peroxide-inducible genes activator [Thalassomonas haliotis]|uniref:LysR family transcriptional regulator n=1 Tax=Thalassomonas haliotis TaxID=485448 RepID=A0ABY7VI75_9GAMM|nr:hydrogen peroxide-inducible genes activator [Thalassomonas haliotis]WDE13173.1 LysR family transcriptional regulator [Thalassomonas haliotis]